MVQETGIKAIPMEKKRQKATWLSGKAFHIAVRRREAKSKGEKKRYNHLNAESQRLARRETKAFFSDPCPDREDNNRTGKTRESLPERQRYQRNVSCQDGPDQGQTWYGPNRSRRCGDPLLLGVGGNLPLDRILPSPLPVADIQKKANFSFHQPGLFIGLLSS